MSTFMAIDGEGTWHRIFFGYRNESQRDSRGGSPVGGQLGMRTDNWMRVEWIAKGRYRIMTGTYEDEPIELTSTDPGAP